MNTPIRRHSGSVRAPVLCLIAALGGAGAMFVVAQKEKGALQSQLTELREQVRQAEAKAADPKEVERLRAQAREAAEFKKEAEEVHRLRGEVTLLRKDKAVFEQASAENVQLRQQVQQAQRLQAELGALQSERLRLTNEIEQALRVLRLQGSVGVPIVEQARERAVKNSCIANLKQIDGAIQQWALESRKVAASPVDMRGVVEYLKGRVLPLCPAGGIYRPGPTVSASPTCTIPGHTL